MHEPSFPRPLLAPCETFLLDIRNLYYYFFFPHSHRSLGPSFIQATRHLDLPFERIASSTAFPTPSDDAGLSVDSQAGTERSRRRTTSQPRAAPLSSPCGSSPAPFRYAALLPPRHDGL